MTALDIETDRLVLRLLPLEALHATIAGDRDAVTQHIKLNVPDDWLAESWIAQMRFEQWQDNPAYGPWSVRAIALRDTAEMIGYINCHAAPVPDLLEGRAPNGVEIGYMLFEPWRGQGFAYEAIRGFNRWAKRHGVDSVVLSISPRNRASLALAKKLAARKVGSHIDEKDGPEDIFVVPL
jgi:RimJ/RimL family protein N-acetyltransferase